MLLSAPSRRRTRLGAIPLLFLTVLGLLVGGLGAPAYAAVVTVSGTVTGADNAALPGVQVQLGTLTGTTFTPVATVPTTVTTNASGAWSAQIDDAPGTLHVQYANGAYDTAYFNTDGPATTVAADADTIVVTGGRTGVAEQLVTGSAAFSGVVKRKGSLEQDPLGGVTVTLLSGATTVATRTSSSTAGSVGTFAFDDVVPGTYTLRFAGTGLTTSYFSSSSDSTTTLPASGNFTLANNQTRTDANGFVPSSTVSEIGGRVTTTGGQPINGATITLYTRSPADAVTGQVTYTAAATQNTNSDGRWKLDQTFGKYVVELVAPAFGTFYYQGNGSLGTNRDAAPELEVKEGVATLLNASLTASTTTTISGTVTTGTNTPVQGVEISVEYSQTNAQGQTTWTEVQSTKAKTAADGTYTATVPPVSQGRTYVVGFQAPGFRTQYYDNSNTPAFTREGGEPLSPTIGDPETGINANLTRATQVTGRVTDQAGAALQGVAVTAVVYTPGAGSTHGTWGPLGGATPVTTTTLADGTYVLDVPADTKFRLQFVAPDQRPTRFFPSAAFADEAQTLSVPQSTALTGRNITLPSASTIRGALVETTGVAYAGAGQVTAWKQVTWTELGENGGVSHTSWFEVPNSATTVSNGAFTVRVPQGSYRLKFVDTATTEEGFLPGLVGLDEAPDVTVGVEQTLADQGFQMPSLQTVRGTVVDGAGTPIVGATVGAEYTYVSNILDGVAQPSGTRTSNRTATTQAGGLYTLQLRSRVYRVFASTATLARTYFGDLEEDGTAVARDVVVSSADVSGIDIILGGGTVQNTRDPWISGLNDAGGTLTANPGSWSPESSLSFAYAWESKVGTGPWTALTRTGTTRSDGLGNPSADGRTVALPTASPICQLTSSCPQNAAYRVTVTATRPNGSASELTLPTAVMNDNNPTAEIRALPRITGRAVVGQTLSTDSGIWATQSTYTYQWYRGLTKIEGATASTYKPIPADVGSNLMVEVRPSGSPNLAPVASNPTARVGNGTFTVSRSPSISGTAQVGEELTANPGTWNPTPASYSYQWFANGQPIAGATQAVYTPVEADVAKVLTVQVTAQQAGYTPATRTSQGTDPVSLDGTDPTKIVNKTKPTIEGTAQVGRTLTAQDGQWTNAPTFSYQWQAGGVDITGATAKTFVLTAAEEGKAITVKVTARRQGFENVTVTSDATNPVAKGVFTNSAKPTITGTVRPGSSVTALPGTWTPSTGVTYAYQWLLDNTAIAGATTSTYSVKDADLGKLLSVRVTATSPGYADSSTTSDQVKVTEDGDTSLEVTSASVVNGQAVVGQTLRLVLGSTSPDYDTVAIQWLRGGTPVAGRTGTSYAVTRDDLGAALAARVTYRKTGFTDAEETITTAVVTAPSEPVKPALSTVKKIKGNKLVLKVNVTATTQEPVTGDVELAEGGRTLVSKALIDGKRKLVVRGLKKGFHSVRVTFLGNDLVKQRSKTITFTIR